MATTVEFLAAATGRFEARTRRLEEILDKPTLKEAEVDPLFDEIKEHLRDLRSTLASLTTLPPGADRLDRALAALGEVLGRLHERLEGGEDAA